ncbi:MAG: hypothetical protein AABZ05_07725 [Nitrospirota bacterium]
MTDINQKNIISLDLSREDEIFKKKDKTKEKLNDNLQRYIKKGMLR